MPSIIKKKNMHVQCTFIIMLNWNGNYRKLACCSSLVRISSSSNSLFICHIIWPKILSALLGDYTQINVTSRPLKVKQQDHWLSFNNWILLFRIHSCFGVVKEKPFWISHFVNYGLTRSLNIPAAMASRTSFLASSSWKIKLTQLGAHLF